MFYFLAGITIHWIERAPTAYSCLFGLSAVLEVLLLIGCLVRLACPVVCWMCFAFVVVAYLVAILVHEWQVRRCFADFCLALGLPYKDIDAKCTSR
jgi:hypothetical protein